MPTNSFVVFFAHDFKRTKINQESYATGRLQKDVLIKSRNICQNVIYKIKYTWL